jgi:hypothetical protein
MRIIDTVIKAKTNPGTSLKVLSHSFGLKKSFNPRPSFLKKPGFASCSIKKSSLVLVSYAQDFRKKVELRVDVSYVDGIDDGLHQKARR